MNNNPGILQDMWTFDSGFNALLGGIPVVTPGLAKAAAARSRLKIAVEEWNEALTKMMIGEEIYDKWRDMSDVSATMKLRSEAFRKTDANKKFQATQQLSVLWYVDISCTIESRQKLCSLSTSKD